MSEQIEQAYIYDGSESGSDLIEEGNYEVIIDKIDRRVTKNGKNKLVVQYRIRKDVEQKYGNKCVFEDIWEEKEHSGVFNRKRINQLLGTQHVTKGTRYNSINEVINFLTGAALNISVKITHNEYYDEDENEVGFYSSSKIKKQVLGAATPETTKKQEELKKEIDKQVEDDLPF